MTSLQLQYFKACYIGNVAVVEKLHTHQPPIAFTFHFPTTSSYYYNTGRESMDYSALTVLRLAHELWRWLKNEGWEIAYDANLVCTNIEKCMGLLGTAPDDYEVDYSGMRYLASSLFDDEEWFDEQEQKDLIAQGCREVDIALFNAAKKCNVQRTEELLREGSNPDIDLYNEGDSGDLTNTLYFDISHNEWFYNKYLEVCFSDTEINDEHAFSMFRVLFEMASSARLLRSIKQYQQK